MARAITGLIIARSGCSGQVVFQGRDLLKERAESRGKQITTVFQDPVGR